MRRRSRSTDGGASTTAASREAPPLRPSPLSGAPIRRAPIHPNVGQPTAAQPTPSMPAPMTMANETLAALLRLQEQTAELHRQFLEGQSRVIDAIAHPAPGSVAAPLVDATSSALVPPELTPSEPSRIAPVSAAVPIPALEPTAPAVAEPTVPQSFPQRVVREPVLASVSTPEKATESTDAAPIADTILSVVADRTGYPIEMLELSMGLDSDLGIDSIKRVEILSALQQQLPHLPAIEPKDLGQLQTLGDIADFLSTSVPVQAGTGSRAVEPETSASSTPDHGEPGDAANESVSIVLLSVIADRTGYPVEMLELSMSLDGDLGIDSIKARRNFLRTTGTTSGESGRHAQGRRSTPDARRHRAVSWRRSVERRRERWSRAARAGRGT